MTLNNNAIIQKISIIILVVVVLYFAKTLLMPLFIGSVLATSFLPFCNWMERKKVPKWLSAFICLLTLLAIIFSLIAVLSWKLSILLDDVSMMKQKIIDVAINMQEYLLKHLGISIEKQTQILSKEQPSYRNMMQSLFGSLTYTITNLILIFVYVSFLLFYRHHIKRFILQLSTQTQRKEVEKIIINAAKVSQQYLVGLAKTIFCLWVMYGIGFSVIGVQNAIFFAMLCGILEIVPFVGNITGTILTIFVAVLHGGSLSLIGGIILIFGCIQLVHGWVLEPLILGHQVKINPLFTIIALIAGELVWSIPGIILAIPLTAIFKIICDHIEPLKPLGFLIGEIETTQKKLRLNINKR